MPTYGKLIDSVQNQPLKNIVNMHVSFFITSSGGWDWSKIDPYVSTDVHNSIAAILPTINDRSDCLRWRNTRDGAFSIKSVSFIWLIAHCKILTNSHHLHRKLTDNAMCPRCGREEETALHALRDCDSVAELWMRILNPQRWNAFFSLDLCDWIEWNRRVHAWNDISENWQTTFGVADWHIWKNRNLIVFENHIPNIFGHRLRSCDIICAELNGILDGKPPLFWPGALHSEMQHVDLQHVYREANRAVDLMAKLSHSLPEGLQSFDAPYAELRSILSSDLSGLLLPRLCIC
ncbi:putative ribonuclease H protein At1g65750 family [Senna tora]|uniref:Putative ribonuclease H protein At1g65750 family n=1 Tax=Senna tora TaxID=362788 RepID=A0A834TYV2_9FABA|nr:putative ribonuclease H protein At1g65750 family [Senna tora]